jgi:uncharacterized protein (TIGR04141 family)
MPPPETRPRRPTRFDVLQATRLLDRRQVAALTGPRHAQPHLAPPEPIDWLEAGWFSYSTEPPDEQHEDLDLDDYLLTLDDPVSIGVARLSADRVEVHSSQVDHTWERWSVYDCLVYETEMGGDLYVLTRGLWFRVASDFVADVRTRLRRIGSATIVLPDAYPHEWEDHYNRRVGETGLAVCMDRRLASPGGTTDRLEFCDLLTPDRHLIHVKKWSSSATLSHLFAQGMVSGETFLADASFRQAVRERVRQLDEALVAVIPEERPDATEYEIVYAIIGKPEVMALPFFSQLALVHAFDRASAFGFRVGTAFVGEVGAG